jgi:hypothetical protein
MALKGCDSKTQSVDIWVPGVTHPLDKESFEQKGGMKDPNPVIGHNSKYQKTHNVEWLIRLNAS